QQLRKIRLRISNRPLRLRGSESPNLFFQLWEPQRARSDAPDGQPDVRDVTVVSLDRGGRVHGRTAEPLDALECPAPARRKRSHLDLSQELGRVERRFVRAHEEIVDR